MIRHERSGFALLVVLLALLALGVIATVTLQTTLQRAVIARTRRSLLASRLRAYEGVAGAIEAWDSARFTDLPVGGSRTLDPAAGVAADVRRLEGGLFLVRGRGRAGPAAARAALAVGALVRVVPATELWRDLPAAIAAAGTGGVRIEAAAKVDGRSPSASPNTPAACDAAAAAVVAALFGAAGRPAVLSSGGAAVDIDPGAVVTGDPPVASAPEPLPVTEPRLGPVRLAPPPPPFRPAAGPVTPRPRQSGGACDTAVVGSWGAPLDPASPCADDYPLIVAPTDLELLGGSGQGVLVAAAGLTLRTGTLFRGVLLAAGPVRIDAGAIVEGAIRLVGGATASIAGTVRYDGCAIQRALEGSPLTHRPFALPGRTWIPLY